MNNVSASSIRDYVGRSAVLRKTISESDCYLFAGITGDFHPNHIDEEYMKEGRFGTRIVHGALLVGFMSGASSMLNSGRTVSAGFENIRFVKPVYFGDTVETSYVIREYDEARGRLYSDVKCVNQRSEVVAVAVHIRALVD